MPSVPMLTILKDALDHGYAVGAFNVHNPFEAEAVIKIHELFRAPAILQLIQSSAGYMSGRTDFANATLEEKKNGAKAFCRCVLPLMERSSVPVSLNLDHGDDMPFLKACADLGFGGVMIDASGLPFEENMALTREVVLYAHERNVTVEAELGALAGREDKYGRAHQIYTDPTQVVPFLDGSGADCLAISYGTLHGPNKGKELRLRSEIAVAAWENMLFQGKVHPLVSHGSSLVRQDIVAAINERGCCLREAHGVPLKQLLDVIPYGIAKINIGTDLRLAILRNLLEYSDSVDAKKISPKAAQIQEIVKLHPDCIDERVLFLPIREELTAFCDSDEAHPFICLMRQAVMETAGRLLVHFGAAGRAPAAPPFH